MELWIAINSCYMFISNLSSPLTIRLATHKNSIAILPNDHIYSLGDTVRMIGLEKTILWFKENKIFK